MAGAQTQARKLAKELRRRGYTETTTGSGHYKLIHPCGEFVIFSKSPSCIYWEKNARGDIRRLEKVHGAPKQRERPQHKPTYKHVEFTPPVQQEFSMPNPQYHTSQSGSVQSTDFTKPKTDMQEKLEAAGVDKGPALPGARTRKHSNPEQRSTAIRLLAAGKEPAEVDELAGFAPGWIVNVLNRSFSPKATGEQARAAIAAGWLKIDEAIKTVEDFYESNSKRAAENLAKRMKDTHNLAPRVAAIEDFLARELGFVPEKSGGGVIPDSEIFEEYAA